MTAINAWCYRVSELFEPDPDITLDAFLGKLQLDLPPLDASQREVIVAAIAKARDDEPDPLNVGRKSDIIEMPGKAVLWFSDGDDLRTADLPEDGGPCFGKCAACETWLWLPDPSFKDDGVVICHGSYHGDAELVALGFEL